MLFPYQWWMTRKEQLKEIPYPTELGESEKDRQDYALALQIMEHLTTMPKTHEERMEMMGSLPRHLQWVKKAYERGEVRWSMVEYLQDRLRAMEAEDQPTSPGSAA
jgi:hypothetical protein